MEGLGTEDLEVLSDLEALEPPSLILSLLPFLILFLIPSLTLSFSAKIIKEQQPRISPDNPPYPTQELLTTHTPGSKRHLNFTTISYDRFGEITQKELPPAAPLIIYPANFKPPTENIMPRIQPIRIQPLGSLKNNIPTTDAPTVPIPVHTA